MNECVIRKVASGYMVIPDRWVPGGMCADSRAHVFRTWAQASAWLRKHLESQ